MSFLAKLWADAVKKGTRTFEEVPETLKEKVAALLEG